MISPTMTVLVLAVLWLIVVIPMLVKHKDDRAGERSVARFGGAMRALSSRTPLATQTRPAAAEERARRRPANHAQVFIPGGPSRPQVPPAGRRPVPAAMEAVMYPDQIAKADMSDARRQMMVRRRRSLGILVAGTVIGLLWGLAAGGALAWTVGLLFLASLAGYLLFLRNQALHDRARRQHRHQRSGLATPRGYDATEQLPYRAEADTVVRIDDEDVELRGVADTVDLTGLYVEEQFDERSMRRAV
jgi:heme exporter protein D